MKYFKHVNFIFIISALCIFACGCKKQPAKKADNKGKKHIQTDPAGASIIFKGKEIGKTPYTISAKPNFYVLKLTKQGYRTRYISFNITKGQNKDEKYILKEATASALVDSQPSGAYVIYKGQRIGETPCVMPDLAFGNHSIRLEKGGYAAKDLNFNVNSDRPLKISTSLESNIGIVVINTNPQGARVILNGKNIGVTPFKGEYPDGEYKLTLQRSNYLDLTTTLAISKGKTVKRSYKLHQRPGSFKIITDPPGAKIYFGGKFVGNSPVTIKNQTANQDHPLIIQAPGFADQKHNIRTSPGREATFTYNLKRNRGDLELVINPPGVAVYVDNEKYGVTQKADTDKTSKIMVVKNLSPGTHTIRYTHRRAIPTSKTIKVKITAGETTRIDSQSLWVPNAELIYNDDSRETVIILSEDGKGVYVEPQNGIRYTVLRSKLKKINYFKDKE